MTINATFWVAISFFIFLGGLVYLKVPQKVNNSLIDKIKEEYGGGIDEQFDIIKFESRISKYNSLFYFKSFI